MEKDEQFKDSFKFQLSISIIRANIATFFVDDFSNAKSYYDKTHELNGST